MATVSIRLDDEIAARITKLSHLTGRTKTYYLTQAITDRLDHLESIYLTESQQIERRYEQAQMPADTRKK